MSGFANATTVTGTVNNIEGSPVANAVVRFQLVNVGNQNMPRQTGTNIIVPETQTATTDSSGQFTITITGNDVITPSGTLYLIHINGPGFSYGPFYYSITGTSEDLSSLTPVATFSNTPSQVSPSAMPALTGDVTSTAGSVSTTVGALHFGVTQLPLSSTAPSSSQFLQWNGSAIVGGTPAFSQLSGTLDPAAQLGTGSGAINLTPASGDVATVTNFADKGGQVFNVKAYGAKCDGVTDDYTALQAAINAAEAVNGIAFVPSATCLSSQPLLINKQMTLQGTIHQLGYVKSQIEFTGNGGGAACTPGTNGELNVQFSSVAVVGVYLTMAGAQANAGTCVVNVSRPGNVEVSGFTMHDAGISGGSTTTTNSCLMFGNADSVSISGTLFSECSRPIGSIGTGTAMIKATVGPNDTFTYCTNINSPYVGFGNDGEVDDTWAVGDVFEGGTTADCGSAINTAYSEFDDAGATNSWLLGRVDIGNTINRGAYAIAASQATLIGNTIIGGVSILPYNPTLIGNSFETGAYVELQRVPAPGNLTTGAAFSSGNYFDGSQPYAYTCLVAPCTLESHNDRLYSTSTQLVGPSVSILALQPTAPAIITSTSPSGTATWAWSGGAGDKKVSILFNAYENTSTTAQIFSLPMPYNYAPVQGTGCPAGISFASPSAPTGVTLTQSSTGGTLAAGTYTYQATATTPHGETLPSTAVSTTFASGTTNSVTVSWTAVAGATGYKVYGRTAGAEKLIATISSGTTTSFVDDGSVTPSGNEPTVNTAGESVLLPASMASVFPSTGTSQCIMEGQ